MKFHDYANFYGKLFLSRISRSKNLMKSNFASEEANEGRDDTSKIV